MMSVTIFANPNLAPGTGITGTKDSIIFNTIAIARKLASKVILRVFLMNVYTVKSTSLESNSTRILFGKQMSGFPVDTPSLLQILFGDCS